MNEINGKVRNVVTVFDGGIEGKRVVEKSSAEGGETREDFSMRMALKDVFRLMLQFPGDGPWDGNVYKYEF